MIRPGAWVSVHGLALLTIVDASLPALTGWGRLATNAAVLVGSAMVCLAFPLPGPSVYFIDQMFSIYLDLTRSAALAVSISHPSYTKVIIWPESASPLLLQRTPLRLRQSLRLLRGQ